MATFASLIPGFAHDAVRRQVIRQRFRSLRGPDALLVSYPKSGSTWLRFLLANAITGLETDFDDVRTTFPPLGGHRAAPGILPGGGRAIRTHEPLRHHGGECQRVVYLARDARPVALSYARHIGRLRGAPVDLAEFIGEFIAGSIDSYGSWDRHVDDAFEFQKRGAAQLRVVRFEDLRSDTVGTLASVLDFLGVVPMVNLDDVVAANVADRMRVKESKSALLARTGRDGSSFVGSGDRPSWEAAVPVELRRALERAMATGLTSLGYPLEFEAQGYA